VASFTVIASINRYANETTLSEKLEQVEQLFLRGPRAVQGNNNGALAGNIGRFCQQTCHALRLVRRIREMPVFYAIHLALAVLARRQPRARTINHLEERLRRRVRPKGLRIAERGHKQ